MTTRFSYRAFGLNIISDLVLPELPAALAAPSSIDLHIELAERIAASLPPEAEDNFHPDPDGGFVFRVPGVADFWVGRGDSIRMALFPGADFGVARLYLLGSALGMAMHQRGWLVMHASAVLRDGAVSLFIGDSGAGKSTLAAAFAKAGFGVLADDVMPVRMNSEGKFEVWPGALSFKLWGDSLDALGLEREGLAEIGNRHDKYFVMNGQPIADAAYPLVEIVVLEDFAEGATLSLETLPKLEAIRAISANTYRPEYIDLLGRRSNHFQQCAVLAAAVPVRRLRRRWELGRISDDVEMLQQLSR